MDMHEVIERLEKIAKHAVHTVGEEPFILSLDDGIALHKAIELLKKQEPLTEEMLCTTCAHNGKSIDEEPCRRCFGLSHWEEAK